MASSGAFAEVTVRDGIARSVVQPAHAAALCAGHFPGDPLLPGSALLGLMAELAATLVDGAPLIVVERCTFRTRVRPDARIVVRARRDPRGHIATSIRVDGTPAARAALRFRA
ncbi:MAG TPA: hypothetical protein VGR62_24445 [Candidatus Binatia bacterium]|jgi:3-hydroxymyristoyl/3-hydroxydecanoyl-(acyl carrier protein) dehydratase|nr:hypothetical protein [Candidatus Binatia bacterium]